MICTYRYVYHGSSIQIFWWRFQYVWNFECHPYFCCTIIFGNDPPRKMGILGHAAEPRHEPNSLIRLRCGFDGQRPGLDVDVRVIYKPKDIQTLHTYMHACTAYLHTYIILHAYIAKAKDGVWNHYVLITSLKPINAVLCALSKLYTMQIRAAGKHPKPLIRSLLAMWLVAPCFPLTTETNEPSERHQKNGGSCKEGHFWTQHSCDFEEEIILDRSAI